MKSKRQHTNVGSHILSAQGMESRIQEDINQLTKKRRTKRPKQSDIHIVYDVTAGKRIHQEKHRRVRQRRHQQVDAYAFSESK